MNRVCEQRALKRRLSYGWKKSRRTRRSSVRQAKKSIHDGLQMDLATGYRFEIEAYNQLVGTDDRKEGVRAFNEKRKAKFQGK